MYFGNMLVQAVCKKLQIHERTYHKEYLVLSKPHFISARINKVFFGSIFVNSYCSITKNIEKSKERKKKKKNNLQLQIWLSFVVELPVNHSHWTSLPMQFDYPSLSGFWTGTLFHDWKPTHRQPKTSLSPISHLGHSHSSMHWPESMQQDIKVSWPCNMLYCIFFTLNYVFCQILLLALSDEWMSSQSLSFSVPLCG